MPDGLITVKMILIGSDNLSSEVILFEKKEQLAIITLNRPPMNALNSQLVYELGEAVAEIKGDSSIKSAIVTGSGEKAFAAGADVNEVLKNSPLEQYDYLQLLLGVFTDLENLEKPTIAAINGLTLGGGCELVLTCDFRIASERARFGQPEINIGVIPGGGGTQRLTRLIGVGRAKEMLYLGNMIDAKTAEQYGLVNKVVPDYQLMEEAEKLAAQLSSKPVIAMRMVKRAVNMGRHIDLHSALNLEIESFMVSFATEDRVEGIKAMLEKRKPNFKGK